MQMQTFTFNEQRRVGFSTPWEPDRPRGVFCACCYRISLPHSCWLVSTEKASLVFSSSSRFYFNIPLVAVCKRLELNFCSQSQEQYGNFGAQQLVSCGAFSCKCARHVKYLSRMPRCFFLFSIVPRWWEET